MPHLAFCHRNSEHPIGLCQRRRVKSIAKLRNRSGNPSRTPAVCPNSAYSFGLIFGDGHHLALVGVIDDQGEARTCVRTGVVRNVLRDAALPSRFFAEAYRIAG